MAFSINRVTLVGNVSQEPELRYTPSGKAVASFNMATNYSKKTETGFEDVPTFHKIIVWGKMAEFISQNLHKGQKVYVDGRIDNRSYIKKDGTKGYTSEIVSENVIPVVTKQGASSKPAEKKEDEFVGDEPYF